MAIEFCTGYHGEPFLSLVRDYPGAEVYAPTDFRVEWGPVFHRGRLDGSARVLVIGQDPAQHETLVRRILVGIAGQRVQGFLSKLGLTRSYVMMNVYLYSVYGQHAGDANITNAAIAGYRHRWLEAIVQHEQIEAVVTFGGLAQKAWAKWAGSADAPGLSGVTVVHLSHPTYPEGKAKDDHALRASLTRDMLKKWNTALTKLRGVVTADGPVPTGVYGKSFKDADLTPVPARDMPAGVPQWMRLRDSWASRVGNTALDKRATIRIVAPSDVMQAGDLSGPAGPMAGGAALMAAGAAAGEATLRVVPMARRAGLTALKGTVVSMRAGQPAKGLVKHVVYIDNGKIAAVQPAADDAPAGFEQTPVHDVKGFIFPGLIDLHNHMPYNVLPLWNVPKKFKHRGQWRDHADYKKLITGPMAAIASSEDHLAAICRYVECKSLFGGTTSSQGITLMASGGKIRKHFRGLVRNVELTDDPDLNPASGTVADQKASSVEKFFTTLKKEDSCYLLHLAEGIPSDARKHFLALKRAGKTPAWALTGKMAGIHSTGLTEEDFEVMAGFGASIVWSPLSNLLLYGQTTDIAAAKRAGVRIALGPDWSPSGNKNLLGELKVVKAASEVEGGLFSDEQIVAMATREAAAVLGWEASAGTIEAGKIADLMVISGTGDPFKAILKADEEDVRLVMVGGEARFGVPELMNRFVADSESVKVGGKSRRLNLLPTVGNDEELPELDTISLAQATVRLTTALGNIPGLNMAVSRMAGLRPPGTGWRLALDEIEDHGHEQRHMMGLPGGSGAAKLGVTRPKVKGAETLAALAMDSAAAVRLDELTLADDAGFVKAITTAANVPAEYRAALKAAYA